jgi:hypothetical protein
VNHPTFLARSLACASVLAVVACTTGDNATSDSTAATVADAPRVVTIDAADYSFAAPDSVPAGLTTIRLVNGGQEMHHVQLLRLTDGHTAGELVDAMKSAKEPQLPAWAMAAGGPNSPGPSGKAEATLDLAAGNYAIICVIPSADGVPHVMKGMIRPLTVTSGGSTATVAEPKADVVVKLVDYAFDMPAITPGRHTIRVENVAMQPHEIFIVQLGPGKTAKDVLDYVATMSGPPPGRPIGGTTFMAKDGVNYITVDLPAGEYGLFCFVPDAKDGKPHFVHGMVKQFTIKS